MTKTLLLSIAAAFAFTFTTTAFAAGPNTYQVTGPILEMNDSMIAVQKGKERWELARNASTSATADLKIGDKVTITYTMTATKIESKAAKGAKNTPSPAASPKR
jgi:hypothetical protein